MPKIPLIYIARPYTAATTSEIDTNIMRAREVGKVVAGLGAYPIIPHANTAHFDGAAPDSFWIPATLEACRRCDAMVVLPGWEKSVGTLGEIEAMRGLEKPIFFAITVDWGIRVANFVDQYQGEE